MGMLTTVFVVNSFFIIFHTLFVAYRPANLAKSMCHDILKEEEDDVPLPVDDVTPSITVAEEVNGNVVPQTESADSIEATAAVAKTNGTDGNVVVAATTKTNNGNKKNGKKRANASNSVEDKKNGDNETNSAAATNADTTVSVEG